MKLNNFLKMLFLFSVIFVESFVLTRRNSALSFRLNWMRQFAISSIPSGINTIIHWLLMMIFNGCLRQGLFWKMSNGNGIAFSVVAMKKR